MEHILRLVEELTPEERDLLFDEMNRYQALRQRIQIGLEQAERGELIDGDVVLAELKARADERLRKSQA